MNTTEGFFSLKMETKITYLKLCGEKQIKSITICILNSLVEFTCSRGTSLEHVGEVFLRNM